MWAASNGALCPIREPEGAAEGTLLPVDYAEFLLPWRERNNELGESD